MSLKEINDKYGRYIWKIANHYHTGMWDAEDVYNQILLLIKLAIDDGKLKNDKSEKTERQIHSFIISRAINITRDENRRKTVTIEQLEFENETPINIIAPVTPEARQFEIEIIRELLFTRLDELTAKFIFELAFPSENTIQIAEDEQAKNKSAEGLHMNINSLKILPKHVAAYFKSIGYFSPSPATVSRMRKKAMGTIYNNEND